MMSAIGAVCRLILGRLAAKLTRWLPLRRPAMFFVLLHVLAMPATVFGGSEVQLYVSPTTKAHFQRIGASYDAMVGPWRKLLSARRVPVREINQPVDLAALNRGVLILPSAVALSDAERRALLHFRDAGGSILATWGLGSRDGRGKWLGYDFVRELMGITVTGEIEKDALNRFLIPYGDSPINLTVPAGRRIWLGQVGEKPLQLKGGVEAGAYLDWARTVLQVGDHHSAIVFDEGGKGTGRRVMFGFAETAWDFGQDDIHGLAGDAINWLRRIPQAQLAAWPIGRRAAQLIEMDTEEGFANAIHFAELIEGMNATGTFYCLTSEARKHRDLVRKLAEHHEISYHGEVHLGFKGLPQEKQDKRLDRMLVDMRDILGDAGGWAAGAGRGFRAPTESYDSTTEVLLQAKGLRHHAADPNSSQDRLPFFSSVATPDLASGLVVLPRGQLDDLNYLQLGLSSNQIGAALVAEYELNLRMGGLGLLSVHSQNFADPERVAKWLPNSRLQSSLMTEALEVLVRHIGPRHAPAWVASGGKIADWWRERSRAVVTAQVSGKRLDLSLRLSGTTPASGLTILVTNPAENIVPGISAADSRSPTPEVRRLDRFTTALVFATIAPGQHGYRLSFP